MLLKRIYSDQHRKRSSPLWLIIFSDMSTNLMLFFLILFAMTRMSDPERQLMIEGMEHAVSDEVRKTELKGEKLLRQIKDEDAISNLRNAITYGKLAGHAKLEVDENEVKVTLNLPRFFSIGSAELNDNITDALSSLAEPLSRFPNDIVIEGHTDNVPVRGGRYRSNWELSVARAVSVIDFFTKRGLLPEQLISAGYGEYHPAYPNDTEDNRSRNRRIEINIIRKQRL
ncbi:MAG: flagellar motor protein MotB [Nitrospirota bacterium]|nr:MAG: flagellar motor protein MotB [Nitrospirota bacterium]